MATTIAIKSEIDSRVLLYYLLKALHNYGSVCLISNNKQVTRLIDGEFEGEFRGMRVIYDMDGATDDTLSLYKIGQDDYDFFILDNCVAWDYDAIFVALGTKQTTAFDYDVVDILGDKRTFIFQFGKDAPKGKEKRVSTSKSKAPVSDDAESYWSALADAPDKGATNHKIEKAKISNKFIIPWPSYTDIEQVEGQWKFPQVFPSELVTPLHTALQPFIGVDIQYFMKEVKRADESGGNLKYRNSTRP